MKRTQALLLAIPIPLALLAGSVFAQIGSGPFSVTNSPYSIVEETEHTQILSDGTHIASKTQRHFYRDSYGRTRIDFVFPAELPISGLARVEIVDPVADKTYILNVRQKTATLMVEARPVSNNPRTYSPPNPLPPDKRPQVTNEDLGSQTIEGLLAKGSRTTITIPTGQQGNDRPIVTVHETWMAADLPVAVSSKNSDPRNGETITRIVSIDRSEPDPALFQVPADYVLRDPNQQ